MTLSSRRWNSSAVSGCATSAAWLQKYSLLQVMTERAASRVLDGRVEIDDFYFGGKREGKHRRGFENKVSFGVVVQTTADGQPVALRLALKALSTSSCVRSDGLKCFAATVQAASHTPIVVGQLGADSGGLETKEFAPARRLTPSSAQSSSAHECSHRPRQESCGVTWPPCSVPRGPHDLNDAMLTICLFNFMSRLLDGHGVEGSSALFVERGQALEEHGCAPLLKSFSK